MTTSTKTTLTAGALIRGQIRRGLFDLIGENITFEEHKYFLESTFVVTVPSDAARAYAEFLQAVDYTFTDKDRSVTLTRARLREVKRAAKPFGLALTVTKLAKDSYRVEARCSDAQWARIPA